ncbi:PrpF family protein [Paracoccus stylophorae]|uniref:PrpF family protein n=1 Tax=Paracoccus stylophorae TaxID=659350 RepID=A0ABY7SVX4_9RHOB|nr:PrpF domain-containing protein [Paracoccus stylophorae]WCR11081.1 PrpF family protein [Paracoccus stylophorae]
MTQVSYPAAFIRGGTSNAVVFRATDLPQDRAAWPALFAAVMGSPDPAMRQLNGMGGGNSSLSKVCVVGPPTRSDADVDYTFAQVSITQATIDLSGNCGNMSSAIGPFAYDEGMVTAPDGMATVRIHNTNSGKIIVARFVVKAGRAVVTGDTAIPGVAGSGAPVELAFLDPGDTLGRGTLPAGAAVETLTLLDGTTLRATMIDAAMPSVFVAASDIGGNAAAHPDAIDRNAALMARLEEVRVWASQAMGITSDAKSAAARIAIPKVAMIAPPAPFRDLSGSMVSTAAHDIAIRMISVGQAHRAVPVTGALALACAAAVEGSIVAEMLESDASQIRIGTPSGVVVVGATPDPGTGKIASAHIVRTQRRLMDGHVYAPAPPL